MGEIFRINNKIIIKIHSNDHNPIHVHVIIISLNIEFKVFIKDMSVEYLTQDQLSAKDEKMVLAAIDSRKNTIEEKWYEIQKDQ